MDTRRCVGVDVGGSKVLIVDLEVGQGSERHESGSREPESREPESREPGSIELRQSRRVEIDADSTEVVGAIAALCAEFTNEVAEDMARPVDHLGLGVAGLVQPDGTVTRSPNVAGVVHSDLVGAVAAATGLSPAVDNDANCVAVAADRTTSHTGEPAAAAGGDEVILAVTLGTGIGGGMVVNGRLVRGADGYASEPGHMVVEAGGIQCRCGQRGCWERYASGSALAAAGAEAVREGWRPEGSALKDQITSERVIEFARSGDEVAVAILNRFVDWLGFGLQNLIGLLNPTRVVIGGGLAECSDLYLDRVRASVAENPQLAGHTISLARAPWGEAAGAVGAALLAGY